MQFRKRQLTKTVLAKALGPLPVLAYALFPHCHLWEVAAWEMYIWEVATWEVALGKIPFVKNKTPLK